MSGSISTRLRRLEMAARPVGEERHWKLYCRIASIEWSALKEMGIELVTDADCGPETWRQIQGVRAAAEGDWQRARDLRSEKHDRNVLNHIDANWLLRLVQKQAASVERAIKRAKRRLGTSRSRR